MDLLMAVRAPALALACLAAIALPGRPVSAQQADQAEPPAADLVDVGDLWRLLRDKPRDPAEDDAPRRMFVVAPVIGSKPDTGLVFGGAGNVAFYRGDPETTHISTSVFGLTFSQKGQTLSNVRLGVFTDEDRWLIAGDNRFNWTSQDTFGLGTSSEGTAAVNAKYDFFRLYETVYRRIAANVFLGGGIHFNTHNDIRPADDGAADWEESPNVVYSRKHGLPVDSGTSGGVGLTARFDSRDSQINARRGWFSSVDYRAFFEGFLGGDSGWHQLAFDVRTYRDMARNGRHRLALWIFGDFVAAGVAPYFDLPATGMDTFGRSGRGYQEGRFRGNSLTYAEIEYRGTLTANGLLGMVAFLNATTAGAKDTGEALFDTVAPGLGIGARVLLNKRSRTNLCVDVGWGRDGSRGLYLAVQEVF
jgi:hypothetical protein